MPDIWEGLADQRDALSQGTCSSRGLVDLALERHALTHDRVLAVMGVRAEAARNEADASDARREAGKLRSSLDGVAILLKDNMVQQGEPTSCASRILQGYRSPFDATVAMMKAGIRR